MAWLHARMKGNSDDWFQGKWQQYRSLNPTGKSTGSFRLTPSCVAMSEANCGNGRQLPVSYGGNWRQILQSHCDNLRQIHCRCLPPFAACFRFSVFLTDSLVDGVCPAIRFHISSFRHRLRLVAMLEIEAAPLRKNLRCLRITVSANHCAVGDDE